MENVILEMPVEMTFQKLNELLMNFLTTSSSGTKLLGFQVKAVSVYPTPKTEGNVSLFIKLQAPIPGAIVFDLVIKARPLYDSKMNEMIMNDFTVSFGNVESNNWLRDIIGKVASGMAQKFSKIRLNKGGEILENFIVKTLKRRKIDEFVDLEAGLKTNLDKVSISQTCIFLVLYIKGKVLLKIN